MIFPSIRVRILVATRPIAFGKGHDSLAAMVKNELRRDPFTGTVPRHGARTDGAPWLDLARAQGRARKADRLKLPYWVSHGSRHWFKRPWRKFGPVMACKRLEEHTFPWPAVTDGLMPVDHARFEALFAGLDWRRVRAIEARTPEAVE